MIRMLKSTRDSAVKAAPALTVLSLATLRLYLKHRILSRHISSFTAIGDLTPAQTLKGSCCDGSCRTSRGARWPYHQRSRQAVQKLPSLSSERSQDGGQVAAVYLYRIPYADADLELLCRYLQLSDEVRDLEAQMERLTRSVAPALVKAFGVGPDRHDPHAQEHERLC